MIKWPKAKVIRVKILLSFAVINNIMVKAESYLFIAICSTIILKMDRLDQRGYLPNQGFHITTAYSNIVNN